MQFDHPSKQSIEVFNLIQEKKKNPHPFSICLNEFIGYSAFYVLLFGSFFAVVNPYGRASRIRYEQKFNPVWRHARKLVPFGILLSSLVYADSKAGLI